MRRFDFAEPLSKAYDKIDENIIDFKSGVIGLCADIDRFFGAHFNSQLSETDIIEVTPEFNRIFPILKDISSIQLEELKNIFCKIRNINAHLFLSIPITISSELEGYFSRFEKPIYDITYNGELTVFGMIYILSFLSQKYQIGSFIIQNIQCRYFYTFMKRDTSDIQKTIQNCLNKLCGRGKPSCVFEGPYEEVEVQIFNDVYKKYITRIFFGIEKCILKWKLSSKTEPSFNCLLVKNEPFAKRNRLIFDLTNLRNFWFHGMGLFDKITVNGKKMTFTLEYVIEILTRLNNVLKGNEDYEYVVNQITEFGEKLIHFYLIHMVETSYKLLDKALLAEDKVNSRIEKLNRILQRLESVGPAFFENAVKLINKEEVSYVIGASKFADILPRETNTSLLKIAKISSKQNIKIGDFESSFSNICIAIVDINAENINKINGVSPLDFNIETGDFYSQKILVGNINLD